MIKRIIEVSSPSRLHVKHKQMEVVGEDGETRSVPIEDIGLLIIEGRGITCSSSLLSECSANNVAVIFCNDKHLPSSALVPFYSHGTQTQIIETQISVSVPVKKRIWTKLVKAKIEGQARTLETAGGEPGYLREAAKRVRSGDPENVEAQAARYYWPRLFGNDFRRERKGGNPNPLLNYGYTIVRAAVARAVVGAGLHPSIGINHSNKYNPFCLADDLLEPLRPLVDEKVRGIWKENRNAEITKETKRTLLEILTGKIRINGKGEEFLPALHLLAASLRREYMAEGELLIPEW